MNDKGDPDRGLVWGHALGIRSDEWMIHSSFVMAQYANRFPVENDALGYGKTPLLFRYPTTDFFSLIKPALWGYSFLDIERGFSWEWNFRIFPFLIAVFLLLMLLSKNNFMLSVFGCVWLFLSSAIQWWSMNTEIFTFGCFTFLSFIYIIYSVRPVIIVWNAILFLLSAYSFVMVLYPAYQVPLTWFLVALLAGYLIRNKADLKEMWRKGMPWNVLTLSVCLLLLATLMIFFYLHARETIVAVANTVYPGKRNETGGDFSIPRLFTDNFKFFMSEFHLPKSWKNICELSSFLMLSPVATIVIIIQWMKTKRIDALLLFILVYQIMMCIWLCIGFPEILAKLTLMNTSPARRAFFIFGFANVVATIVFLAHHQSSLWKSNTLLKIFTFVILLISAYTIHFFLNKDSYFYFSGRQVLIATIVFSVLSWLLIFFHEHRIFRWLFIGLCLAYMAPNVRINPLSVGLAPYFENKFYQMLSGMHAAEPDAKWVVFGQNVLANYLKAAGMNCFNGVQYVPELEKLHILDPDRQNESIYNRYAHIELRSLQRGDDAVLFSLNQEDFYTIHVNPCSPKFDQLGIKYFVFTSEPGPSETECMSYVANPLGMYIFKRNNE